MNNSVTYQVNLRLDGEDIIGTITGEIDRMRRSTENATKSFGDCFKTLLSFSQVAEGLSVLEQQFDSLIEPGIALNSNMAELSAITGVTGKGLKEIEDAARVTAKTFGTDASANVESYKLVLSQLSPEIAKSSKAMQLMGEHINVLSKQMKGDTVTATNVLTTSMNQFGISTENPIEAAKVMGEMMNTMSAAAQAGSAELPQIQSALEQVGMVAKTTGLSFEETNAQIQILDKAGKKGSEGGVALRNVLTTLSQGRFTAKDAAQGLELAGISVDYLSNTSIPLTERLKALKSIQGDTALMSKVFGKENMAAAIAMIEGADEAENLTKQITGTNSAVEQADIIMGSYAEKMARSKAWWDDIKISIFNYTKGIMPALQRTFTFINVFGQLATAGHAIYRMWATLSIKATINTIKIWANTIATKINTRSKIRNIIASQRLAWSTRLISMEMMAGAIASRISAMGFKGLARSLWSASFGARGLSVAIMSIPLIGWILAGITAVIVAFKLLWEHSRRFREILYGIAYVGKAVFHNIGIVIKRLWSLVIKPVVNLIWNNFKTRFLAIQEMVKKVITSIGDFFMWLWSDAINPLFNWIYDTGVGIWDWLTKVFGSFGAWIKQTLIAPIYEAFSKVWTWLSNLLDKIMNKLSEVFKPIIDLWNKLFSSEGMKDIKVEYEKGKKAGGESFDKDQKQKEPQKVELVENQFDLKKDIPKTPTIGGSAGRSVTNSSLGTTSENSNKVRNLSIGKMIENLNIQTTTTNGIDKTQLYNAIREVMMTVAADSTLMA